MDMLAVHPFAAVAIPLVALMVGLVLGGCLRAGSVADAWAHGYNCGRRAAQEQQERLDNLPDPRFVGDE
jgi:hypothetical protein